MDDADYISSNFTTTKRLCHYYEYKRNDSFFLWLGVMDGERRRLKKENHLVDDDDDLLIIKLLLSSYQYVRILVPPVPVTP